MEQDQDLTSLLRYLLSQRTRRGYCHKCLTRHHARTVIRLIRERRKDRGERLAPQFACYGAASTSCI